MAFGQKAQAPYLYLYLLNIDKKGLLLVRQKAQEQGEYKKKIRQNSG
jgi:hypothetical protein